MLKSYKDEKETWILISNNKELLEFAQNYFNKYFDNQIEARKQNNTGLDKFILKQFDEDKSIVDGFKLTFLANILKDFELYGKVYVNQILDHKPFLDQEQF